MQEIINQLTTAGQPGKASRWKDKSGVAQWLACWAHNPKVPGSKPGSATRFRRFGQSCASHGSSAMVRDSLQTRALKLDVAAYVSEGRR